MSSTLYPYNNTIYMCFFMFLGFETNEGFLYFFFEFVNALHHVESVK